MRILYLSYRYPPVARASNLHRSLAETLVARGHEVTVITKYPTEYVPEDESVPTHLPVREAMRGVNVVRVRGLPGVHRIVVMRALEHIVAGLAFVRAIKAIPRPDVMLTISPPMPVAFVSAFYSRLARIGCVLNLHDLYPRTAVELGLLKNRWVIWAMKRLENAIYRLSTHIVVTNRGSVPYLVQQKKIPPDRVSRVPNWVPLDSLSSNGGADKFRAEYGLEGRCVVSYAGVMGFAQDLSTIIDCARLLQARSDIVFLLIGDGVYAEKWKLAAAGLENVRFLPPVTEERYYDALRASDIGLVALTESLGSPAIPGKMHNIMAVARPVVAVVPSKGNTAEVVRESRCGFVVVPGDKEDLRNRIEELAGCPDLRNELGAHGRSYAEQNFSLEKAADIYERILKDAQDRPI